MEVNDIIKKARELGACDDLHKATDWKSLSWLFFSPQGREFCAKNNYPRIEDFREMNTDLERLGIFIDCNVERSNEDIALIGEGCSTLLFSGVAKPYRVILMHGAKAEIRAGNYAVVKVENISGDCEVFNDGTATVL